MIERKIVDEKMTEFLVEQFLNEQFNKVGHSHTEIQKTPVGEKILIHASRPGLIVGSRGANIKKLTRLMKSKFKFDNPQIDIVEIKKPAINAQLVAENLAYQFERFGSQRFKALGYRAMEEAMKHGAMGIEILVSGKVPSTRAKTWRFYIGYLKKSGDIAVTGVKLAYAQAKLKTGVIGIQVRIMPGDLVLPDKLELKREIADVTAEIAPENIIDASKQHGSRGQNDRDRSRRPQSRGGRSSGSGPRRDGQSANQSAGHSSQGHVASQTTEGSSNVASAPAESAENAPKPLNLKDALKAKQDAAKQAAAKKE
jgi:small subunit ribosomal protein S3